MFVPVLAAALCLAAVTSAAPSKRQTPPAIYSCTVPNTVAITFDDGPYNYINDIVNTLNNAGAKGTFFVNSNNWDCIYNRQDAIRTIYNSGHQLASHTSAHKNLAELNWDQLHDEFWRVEQALQRIVGVQPAFMRPPYGSFDDEVLRVAENRGQRVVIWDFDSGDSVGLTADQSRAEYDRVIGQRPSNILTLNHETHASTAYEVLPYAIQRLQQAGYRLVTVAECLGMEPYQWVGQPQQGSWTC